MPKRGRKKRKTLTPHKAWSNFTVVTSSIDGKDASMEENADLECYTAVEVEEVADVADVVCDEEDDDVRCGEEDDDEDEVLRIDTSWIKEEPVEEELYINSQEEHNGDGHGMKRKREEEEEHDTRSKYIKTESDDDYATVDSQELINDNVKTEEEEEEEEEENMSDDYWEEEEEDVAPVKDPFSLVVLPIHASMQRCAKCAIMFAQGSSNLPSALQNLCRKCKPNVSITCKFCGKHFEHHKLYKRHVRDCSTNRFECRNCKNRFPTQRKFSCHKCVDEDVLQLLRYICPICSEGFDKLKHRNHHKSLHVTNKSIKCKSCKMLFPDLPSFQEHMDIHSVMRMFICTTCHLTIDTLAQFYNHKRMHAQKEGKDEHEIERPPDFVYVCKACKYWFADVISFHDHGCVKKQTTTFVQDFLQVANDIPKMLDGAVPTMLDFGIPNTLGVPCEAPRPRKPVLVPARVQPARVQPTKNVYYTRRLYPKPPATEAKSAPVKEAPIMVLDSAYTCQLCQVSFKTSNALGYHSCLTEHKAFDGQDDDDEEEEDEEEEEEEEENNKEQGADNEVLSQGKTNIRIKLTKSLKTLNYSDVMSQAEPKQDSPIPTVSETNGDQSSSNFKHTHLCMVCNVVVKHNFEHVFRRASARYLCPGCMQKAAKQKNYVFKCSKCGQKFPTWDRLNMHLPWHKERTGEEGVFRAPRLACKQLPKRDEACTSSLSLSPAQQVVPDVNSSEGAPVGQNNDASGKEEASVSPKPHDNLPAAGVQLASLDTTLLSALLKEPVIPTSNSVEAGPEKVKDMLRKKLTDRAKPIRIAPKLSTANSIEHDQIVINAPLIASKNMGNFTIVNQGDSLMSQVSQGMFPPVVDSASKHPAMNAQNPSMVPASNVQEYKGTLLKVTKDNGVIQKDPNVQEYKGMLLKITKDGARQTIQVLPQQSAPNPSQPQVQTKTTMTTTGVPLSSGQTAISVGMAVGSYACVTAPIATSNTTVPLSIGGNTLSKNNLDSNLSTLTGPINNAAGPGTKYSLRRSDRIEAAAASSNPVSVISFRQTRSSTAKAASVTIQKNQPTGTPSPPVHGSLPGDLSQPSDTQSPRGVFLCYSCNHLFMDIASLKAHGCKIQAFSCHLCNNILQTAEQLYTHKCTTWSFTCHMCNKKCRSAEELNQHPCIDTNDIRIEQGGGSGGTDNPVNTGPVFSVEKEGGEAFNAGTSKGSFQGANTREVERSYRSMSWKEVSKVKDFTCPACGATFNTKASLYIHKMKHNLRV